MSIYYDESEVAQHVIDPNSEYDEDLYPHTLDTEFDCD